MMTVRDQLALTMKPAVQLMAMEVFVILVQDVDAPYEYLVSFGIQVRSFDVVRVKRHQMLDSASR